MKMNFIVLVGVLVAVGLSSASAFAAGNPPPGLTARVGRLIAGCGKSKSAFLACIVFTGGAAEAAGTTAGQIGTASRQIRDAVTGAPASAPASPAPSAPEAPVASAKH